MARRAVRQRRKEPAGEAARVVDGAQQRQARNLAAAAAQRVEKQLQRRQRGIEGDAMVGGDVVALRERLERGERGRRLVARVAGEGEPHLARMSAVEQRRRQCRAGDEDRRTVGEIGQELRAAGAGEEHGVEAGEIARRG